MRDAFSSTEESYIFNGKKHKGKIRSVLQDVRIFQCLKKYED